MEKKRYSQGGRSSRESRTARVTETKKTSDKLSAQAFREREHKRGWDRAEVEAVIAARKARSRVQDKKVIRMIGGIVAFWAMMRPVLSIYNDVEKVSNLEDENKVAVAKVVKPIQDSFFKYWFPDAFIAENKPDTKANYAYSLSRLLDLSPF